MGRYPSGDDAALGFRGIAESSDAGFQFLVLGSRNGVFQIGVFDFTEVDQVVGTLNDEVDLGLGSGIVSPGIKLHGDAVQSQGMAYLVLVGDTNPFESQPQPSVGYGRVEVLLPIVVGGDFLGESKME